MKLTAKQRAALPDSDFGIPETRQFPIHDKAHVRAACRFLKYAPKDKQAALIKRINKRAKELGMNLSVGRESAYYDPTKGTSFEASNVGTLEPIVSPTETVIPGGGHLLDEEEPSFGARVMDMIFKKKIVREDYIAEEGAVLSRIIIPDPYDKHTFLEYLDKEKKAPKFAVPIRNMSSALEKNVLNAIYDGERRRMVKYMLGPEIPVYRKGTRNGWNEVAIRSSDLIYEIVRDKDIPTDEAANRIYCIINTCPKEDLQSLMCMIYHTADTLRRKLIFDKVAEYIAKGRSVFKGAGTGIYEPHYKYENAPRSYGFTPEENHKLDTVFGEDNVISDVYHVLAIALGGNHIFGYQYFGFMLDELLELNRITGFKIIHSPKINLSLVFVKCFSTTGVMFKKDGTVFGFYRLKDDDITKLADVCVRVARGYTTGRDEDVRMLFERIGYTCELYRVPINPATESVASIFKDAKNGVIKALRRIHIGKDGEVSINLKDELTLANYSETHRLLMADLNSDDVTGLKLNTAYVFSLITIIETKYLFGKNVDKYSKDYKDAIKLRGMLISDFNTGLNAIRKKEPGFSFIKFYKESGYENAVYKFNTKALTNLSTEKLIETVFQNAIRLKSLR